MQERERERSREAFKLELETSAGNDNKCKSNRMEWRIAEQKAGMTDKVVIKDGI